MAQHDYVIANQGFPAFRSDLNDALAAVVSNNSGATEPTTMFAHQIWVDTAADPSVLKIRNADNDAWITIGTINQTADTFKLTPAGGISTDTIAELTSAAGVTIDGVLLKDGLVNTLTVGQGAGSISTNTAVGASALAANTTGANNTAVGYQALDANTTGRENIAVGTDSLGANTTGVGNCAFGYLSLRFNTTASFNTAFGAATLNSNTTGANNTALGYDAMASNTTGANNTAVGKAALTLNTTGSNNTAVGFQALQANSGGSGNVAAGRLALNQVSSGNANTGIGQAAGYELTTGSNNILLGADAGRATSPSGSITTGSNNVVLGDNSITNLYCADTTISSSDARDKTDVQDFTHGLDWVTQLRPVTYRWDKRAWYVGDEATTEDLLNAQPDGSKKRQKLNIGFLAQEELAIENQFGFGTTKDDMLIVNLNEDDSAYGLKYERLVPVLVNAIKELKAEIDQLKGQ